MAERATNSYAELETRILHWIETEGRERGLALLDELLQAARDGEAAMQTIVAREFFALGYETDVFTADLDALASHPEFSLLPELASLGTANRPNVVARWPGAGGGRSLFAFAHIDSYILDPARWSVDPYRVTLAPDGRACGYGIADDRSGIVGMLLAARALSAIGVLPGGTVTMASCLGKHLGAGGTLAVMARGYGGDGAVYLHPAETGVGLAEYKAVSLGLVQFKITVEGMAPEFREWNQTPAAHLGINAIERAANLISGLRHWAGERATRIHHPAVDAELGRSTNLNITTISGGESDRRVPETCVITGMIAFPPGETVAAVRADFVMAAQKAATSIPGWVDRFPVVEWLPLMANPGDTDPDGDFARTFVSCLETTTGQTPRVWPAHTASDIRYPILYANAPTVGFGPRAGNFGGPDEWLDVDDFLRAVQCLALLIIRWCGVGGGNR